MHFEVQTARRTTPKPVDVDVSAVEDTVMTTVNVSVTTSDDDVSVSGLCFGRRSVSRTVD